MTIFAKYLVSSLASQRCLQAAAAAALSSFPRIILLRLSRISSTIVSNNKPTGSPEPENTCPISKFLLNECGLCQSELSAIFKLLPALVATRYTAIAKQAVQLLRDSGCTEQQVRKTITRNPSILLYNVDRSLKPKIEFMKTLGLTAQDFGRVISIGSRLLTTSLEKTLSPNIQHLQNFFGSEADVSHVFKAAPHILVKRNAPEVWVKKLKHLTSFGLLEDEIKDLVWRHPLILNVSMDKVQKNMDFFMHTAGLPAKFILSYPTLVSCHSLECRIKPRHRVLSAVIGMQPSKRPPLIGALVLSEQKFLEKYVHCSPHATKLLEIYRGPLPKD